MDITTKQFFLKVLTILGLENDSEHILQEIYRYALSFAVEKSRKLMEGEKQKKFDLMLHQAYSITEADTVYRQFVNEKEYAKFLFLGSQHAFETILMKRGKPLSMEEKQALLSCIPANAKTLSQQMENLSIHDYPQERRSR